MGEQEDKAAELNAAREVLREAHESMVRRLACEWESAMLREGDLSARNKLSVLDEVIDCYAELDPSDALEALFLSGNPDAYFEGGASLEDACWAAAAHAAIRRDVGEEIRRRGGDASFVLGPDAPRPPRLVSVQIDMKGIPHGDKLAYGAGYAAGLSGETMPRATDRYGLAEGYKLGHAHGRRVLGGEAAPAWAKTLPEIGG